jgi:hypothetical protein
MPSIPGPHTGIFREENTALRFLFGYDHFDLHLLPSSLQSCTTLGTTALRDVLHVAIDVDTHQGYEDISPEPEYHIGLSILDARSLLSSNLQLENVVKSHQFIIGKTRYCRRAGRRFLFGESEEIQIDEFAAKFSSLVGDRKYILVLHGADSDSTFLETFGVVSKATYLVDTNKPAQFILKLYYRYSLEKLLDNLGIAYRDLHAAGNDAHFVLKAYLRLVIKDAEMFFGTEETTLIGFLRLITCTPIPPRKPEPPAAPKKLGVYAKRRLKQARKEAKRMEQMAAAERAAIEKVNGEADESCETFTYGGQLEEAEQPGQPSDLEAQ